MTALLIVIYIVFIALGLPDSLFGVSWPVLHTELNVPESFASVYSMILSVCTGGASFLAGTLIRKFGTAKVTLISLVITCLGLVGISFAPNIALMLIFSIIMGYGAGAIDTGVNNFVALHYKAHHMNWLHCFWGVGITVSPIIMSHFLKGETGGWRGGYRVIALLELLIVFIVLIVMRKWQNVEKNDRQQRSDDNEKGGSMRDILKIRGVISGIASLGVYCCMEFLLTTWGASYAVNVFALTPDEAAKWVSLFFCGIMLGRMLAGFFAMKFSDKSIIRASLILAFAGIVVMALPLGKLSLISWIVIGIGMGPVFPSILHMIPARFGTKYSADITGYHEGGAYITGFTVQIIFGYAATAISFKITPFVLLLCCVLTFIINEKTNRLTNKKSV